MTLDRAIRCASSPVGRYIAVAAVGMTVLLTACGGGGGSGPPPTYTVGGQVSGLAGGAIVIDDPSAGQVTVSANGNFTLPKPEPTGSAYSVSVLSQPASPAQNCAVTSGGTGTLGTSNVQNVEIACQVLTFPISLTVRGLIGVGVNPGLIVADSSGDQVDISQNGTTALPTAVPSGAAFSVSIASQPLAPPQNCTLTGGSGTVGASSPAVTITCAGSALTSRPLDFVTGGSLGSIVADPSRQRIYIAAIDRNELLVLDANSYLVLNHFYVGSAPSSMALSADDQSLYVGLSTGGALAVVDLNTFAVNTIPVASQMGTAAINTVLELSPGVVLLGGAGAGTGGGPTSGVGNLLTVDLNHQDATQPVAASLMVRNVFALIRASGTNVVYGLGDLYPAAGAPVGSEILFSLDGTQPALPLLASNTSVTAASIVASQDGLHLLSDAGDVFDATTLARLSPATQSTGGAVGETPDDSVVMQTTGMSYFTQRDPKVLSVVNTFTDDCPEFPAAALVPTLLRGEWMIEGQFDLCVVSTTNPATAPGSAGSRALPSIFPDPVTGPWLEISDGADNDSTFDPTRGVAYVANGFGLSVDLYSVAEQVIVGSIPVGGRPQVVVMSSDGNTLYAGLSDTGEVLTIDLNARVVTSRVTLTASLGTPVIFRIAEIAPGHVLVGAIPSEGGVGPNTYLVDVVLSNPASAQRVGCAAGYQGPVPVVSPDRHYLYLMSASSCVPEKRDLTQPGYPVVVSGPANGYVSRDSVGGGRPVVTADGAHLILGGIVIDTTTLQQTGDFVGGAPLPSANPDRYYLVGLQSVATMELHDLKVLSITENVCQSTLDGVDSASISADEKTVIAIGDGFQLCVTQLAP